MDAAAWTRPGHSPQQEATVNYAATLAVLVVLAFSFPLGVRLARSADIPFTLSASALGALALLALAITVIRWRVALSRRMSARAQTGREQVARAPHDPAAYHVEGEHLGTTLLRLGRRREATEVIERYARLPGVQTREVESLRAGLAALLRRAHREVPQGPAQDAR